MKIYSRLLVVCVLSGGLAGCSSNSDDLTGTWTGTDSRSNGTSLGDTVTLATSNGAISGTLTATVNGVAVYSGTVTGSYSRPNFNFSVSVPLGGVINEAGCAYTFSGSGTFVDAGSGATSPSKTLSGTFTTTPSGNCSVGSTTDTFTWSLQGS